MATYPRRYFPKAVSLFLTKISWSSFWPPSFQHRFLPEIEDRFLFCTLFFLVTYSATSLSDNSFLLTYPLGGTILIGNEVSEEVFSWRANRRDMPNSRIAAGRNIRAITVAAGAASIVALGAMPKRLFGSYVPKSVNNFFLGYIEPARIMLAGSIAWCVGDISHALLPQREVANIPRHDMLAT